MTAKPSDGGILLRDPCYDRYFIVKARHEPEFMFCPQCGNQNDFAAAFCSRCGTVLPSGNSSPATPANTVPNESSPVPSGPQTTRHANFVWRLLAVTLDWILLLPIRVLAFVVFVLTAIGFEADANSLSSLTQPGFYLLPIAVDWLYEALMVSSSHQATLGKKAAGIVVTDMQGNPISFSRATGRHFGKYLSSVLLLIGYLIQPFTEKRQTLHDMMAGCLVLRKDPH